MSWQTILSEIGRVWLVSSWITALTFIIWIKTDSKLHLPKGKSMLILISLSITHAIFKTIVPQIAFIFMILLFILISIASYKLTVYKAIKSILKLTAIMFVTEFFLYVLIFKALGIQVNPNSNVFWIASSILTLLLVIILKRKELLKNEYALVGKKSKKHQEVQRTGNC